MLRLPLLLALTFVALAGCSFMSEQVGISTSGACIRQECRDPDAADYSKCEAACRQRYRR